MFVFIATIDREPSQTALVISGDMRCEMSLEVVYFVV